VADGARRDSPAVRVRSNVSARPHPVRNKRTISVKGVKTLIPGSKRCGSVVTFAADSRAVRLPEGCQNPGSRKEPAAVCSSWEHRWMILFRRLSRLFGSPENRRHRSRHRNGLVQPPVHGQRDCGQDVDCARLPRPAGAQSQAPTRLECRRVVVRAVDDAGNVTTRRFARPAVIRDTGSRARGDG